MTSIKRRVSGRTALLLLLGATPLFAEGLRLWAPWLAVTGRAPIAFMTDKKAAYANLFVEPATGSFDALELSGEFPHARYLSFMVYGSSRSQPFSVLPDVAIEPDVGSVNPFRPFQDREAANRRYTIYLVKEGSSFDTTTRDNVLILPETESFIDVVMRVYRPDAGRSAFGSDSLPRVRVLRDALRPERPRYSLGTDLATLLDMALRVDYKEADSFPALYDESSIELYHLTWEGGLPNAHVPYLNAALGATGRGDRCRLAILRFLPPTYERSYPHGGTFTGHEDVRYFSFCTASIRAGKSDIRGADTYECLADDELKPDPDGFVTLVVYPRCLKDEAEHSGQNRLFRGNGDRTTLVYRQMLAAPGFVGDARRVPALPFPLPESIDLDDYRASRYLGDYAPTGKYYTREEFEAWLASRRDRAGR